MFRMLWNAVKDGICYMQNDSVFMKFFLLNMQEATDFIWSGQAFMSFNLLRIFFFFLQKLLASLNLKQ